MPQGQNKPHFEETNINLTHRCFPSTPSFATRFERSLNHLVKPSEPYIPTVVAEAWPLDQDIQASASIMPPVPPQRGVPVRPSTGLVGDGHGRPDKVGAEPQARLIPRLAGLADHAVREFLTRSVVVNDASD